MWVDAMWKNVHSGHNNVPTIPPSNLFSWLSAAVINCVSTPVNKMPPLIDEMDPSVLNTTEESSVDLKDGKKETIDHRQDLDDLKLSIWQPFILLDVLASLDVTLVSESLSP